MEPPDTLQEMVASRQVLPGAARESIACSALRAAIGRSVRGDRPRLDCRPLAYPAWPDEGTVPYEVVAWSDDGRISRRRVIAHFTPEAHRVHATLRGLWRAGFDGSHDAAVAEPVAYAASVSCRVEGDVAGVPLETDGSVDAFAGAGAWIARLHDQDLGGPMRTGRDERRALEDAATYLARCFGQHAARIQTLARTLGRRLEGSRSLVPTHGDFRPDNVIVEGQRVTVVGLERFALAESSRDLGRFMAANLVRACQGRASILAVAAQNEAFLRGYRGAGGTGSLGRVALWTSVSLIDLLADIAEQRRLRETHLEGWLRLAERGGLS